MYITKTTVINNKKKNIQVGIIFKMNLGGFVGTIDIHISVSY